MTDARPLASAMLILLVPTLRGRSRHFRTSTRVRKFFRVRTRVVALWSHLQHLMAALDQPVNISAGLGAPFIVSATLQSGVRRRARCVSLLAELP